MKQGPIRATQQFGLASPSRSQVKQSPVPSPGPKESTRTRARPLSETGLLSGRRSPSSPRFGWFNVIMYLMIMVLSRFVGYIG